MSTVAVSTLSQADVGRPVEFDWTPPYGADEQHVAGVLDSFMASQVWVTLWVDQSGDVDVLEPLTVTPEHLVTVGAGARAVERLVSL